VKRAKSNSSNPGRAAIGHQARADAKCQEVTAETARSDVRATLRGKNAATKIENNSKIFAALSVAKENYLKID
jgi:regulator of protease activity HflC (stomatin/prohibitin superfamily)